MPWNIAERVEQCRTEKGWTRSELARRAHLNATHVWKILEGLRPRVEAETVRRLALALEVSTDYLLGLTEDRRFRTRQPRDEEAAA